jgi:hypothetical protein
MNNGMNILQLLHKLEDHKLLRCPSGTYNEEQITMKHVFCGQEENKSVVARKEMELEEDMVEEKCAVQFAWGRLV